jgi:uncharacterized protein
MRSLRIFTVVLLLAAGGQQLRADDTPSPEALQAAKELFTVLSPDTTAQLAGRITSAFWPMVEQRAHADKIDDATVAEMRKEFDRIQQAFLADAMKEAPAIYARHFTVGELHELTAFYRTPTGAKALHEIPQVMGEFSALLVPHLQDMQRDTTEAFNKILRERGYVK